MKRKDEQLWKKRGFWEGRDKCYGCPWERTKNVVIEADRERELCGLKLIAEAEDARRDKEIGRAHV